MPAKPFAMTISTSKLNSEALSHEIGPVYTGQHRDSSLIQAWSGRSMQGVGRAFVGSRGG